MKPILSICIPTFNRCEYLKKSIESIICQPEFQKGEVEIVISDNDSDDYTRSLVKEYALKYINVRYYCNLENIGIRNFPLAISRGIGTFRKLSNDTFIYRKGSLRCLCDLIKKYASERTQIVFLNGQRKRYRDELIVCNSFEQTMVIMGYWLTWSGIFGIWENECIGIENDLVGCDMLLWHTVKVCKMISEKNSALICNMDLLSVQEVKGKDLSYGLYQVFYLNFLGIIKKYVEMGMLFCERYEEIRKDLLFDFFTSYILIFEDKYNEMSFSDDENLKQLVFKEYKNEEYWSDYEKYYKEKKAKLVIKQKIKSVLKKLHIWDLLVALHVRKQ